MNVAARLVNPVIKNACCCNIAPFITKIVKAPHAQSQRFVVRP